MNGLSNSGAADECKVHESRMARCTIRVMFLYSIVCKKLVPEKTCTRLTDIRASFWCKFVERVSSALLH